MNEQHEEQRLWEAFITGNEEAFKQLFNRYVDNLFVFGMNFTDDEEMVKDCVQDLFVKLYTDRNNLPSVSNVRAYLFNALKNNLLIKKRNMVEFCAIEDLEMEKFESSPESLLIDEETMREQKSEVDRLFLEITPRQREVLYYRYVEELSYEEICTLMNMNYQSVRNLLHRTMAKLRNLKKMI
jgi:RNA polymerase sigma factor (sigma-70 family)